MLHVAAATKNKEKSEKKTKKKHKFSKRRFLLSAGAGCAHKGAVGGAQIVGALQKTKVRLESQKKKKKKRKKTNKQRHKEIERDRWPRNGFNMTSEDQQITSENK
jgi:hypothetical protein